MLVLNTYSSYEEPHIKIANISMCVHNNITQTTAMTKLLIIFRFSKRCIGHTLSHRSKNIQCAMLDKRTTRPGKLYISPFDCGCLWVFACIWCVFVFIFVCFKLLPLAVIRTTCLLKRIQNTDKNYIVVFEVAKNCMKTII